MSAERREYQVRIATRGAEEVEGSVEFTLALGILATPPITTGSLAHPLGGRTEVRPFSVSGVDVDGTLIESFVEDGRWAALGRMADVRWRPVGGSWTIYATGRVSGLDELEGPGLFRISISDESWVARDGRAFGGVDTSQIWPAGPIWPWRGQVGVFRNAQGTRIAQQGELHRIRMTVQIAHYRAHEVIVDRGSIHNPLLRFIREQEKEELIFDDTSDSGNFRHLRLWYTDETDTSVTPPHPDDSFKGYEIVSFGELTPEGMYDSLEEWLNAVGGDSGDALVELNIWVREPGVPIVQPPASGAGFLWAPTAPPSKELPLLVGIDNEDHEFGSAGGYLHPADFTRRVWTKMGLRFDEAQLAELEGDASFPAVAAAVDDSDMDAEQWMEDNVWGPAGLLALKDGQGRRRLVDARWFTLELDLESLPVLNGSTAKAHRWRLVGREMRNRFTAVYHKYQVPFPEPGERIDFLAPVELRSDPYDSDNIEYVGERPHEVNARQFLEPTANVGVQQALLVTKRGQPWRHIEAGLMDGLLEVFQDGPVRYSGEVGKTLADTLQEGDPALVDESELKGANPTTAARSGMVLVMILSLTRHPAHAEYEAIRMPAIDFPVFEETC